MWVRRSTTSTFLLYLRAIRSATTAPAKPAPTTRKSNVNTVLLSKVVDSVAGGCPVNPLLFVTAKLLPENVSERFASTRHTHTMAMRLQPFRETVQRTSREFFSRKKDSFGFQRTYTATVAGLRTR